MLATLIPDDRGIVDIYSQTTYGGGIIPRDRRLGGLMLAEILNDPDVVYGRDAYERTIILITGGFSS